MGLAARQALGRSSWFGIAYEKPGGAPDTVNDPPEVSLLKSSILAFARSSLTSGLGGFSIILPTKKAIL